MKDIDTAKLRALAEAATPGPWKHDNEPGCRKIKGDKSGSHKQAQYTEIAFTVGLHDDEKDDANATFIAAANPQTVIALLDIVDRQRDALLGKPITEAEIKQALAQGRIERKMAEGDHAWTSLVERNEALTKQLAAMTAARDEACAMIQKLVDAQARYSPPVVAESSAFAAMKREIDRRIAELRKVGP